MALKRKTLRVYLDNPNPLEDEPIEHVVSLTLGDQLRGELEAKKQGIEISLPIHMTTVFAWCAVTRLGLYAGDYQQFANVDCLEWEKAGDPTDEVDPTQLAALTGSPLSSPLPTPAPAPAGGSMPSPDPTATS